jgi:hypothetical protein
MWGRRGEQKVCDIFEVFCNQFLEFVKNVAKYANRNGGHKDSIVFCD